MKRFKPVGDMAQDQIKGTWVSLADYEALAKQLAEANAIIAAHAAAMPTKWPQTPAEIREFVGWNANSKRYANAPTTGDDLKAFLDYEPSENDTYAVSAHDLLSSFAEWEDFNGAPEEPPAVVADLSDEVWCDLQCAEQTLKAISTRINQVGEVLEPVSTITQAATMATTAYRRILRAIKALEAVYPTQKD